MAPGQLELIRTARSLRRLVLNGDRHAAAELRLVESRLSRVESESRGVPAKATAAGPVTADPDRLAAALQPDQVLISFLADPRASRIWVLSRNGRASAALPESAVLSRAVEAHRAAILAGSDALDEGHALYQLLFSGIPQKLLAHPYWIVVADGPLWSIPWAALVAQSDQRREYLVESKSLDLIPSATWLLSDKNEPESSLMLAAGNAIHNRADSRFRPARLASSAVPMSFWVWPPFQSTARPEPVELPGLVGSRRELSDSCRAWTAGPCRTLSGAALTLDNLVKEISQRPAVVHLATHLFAHPDPQYNGSGLELGQDFRALPALEQTFLALSLRPDLTRETVQPSDVSRMYAPGSLVVLSACGSGRGTILQGAGLQGFGRAWLASGARGVVATLWPVSDETSEFFSGFYAELSSVNLPGRALRSAQLQALRRRGWQSKPRFWAAYMILGKD
jgi:CHAT domain-containing protein